MKTKGEKKITLEIYVISCAVCACLGYITTSILFNRYLDQLHKNDLSSPRQRYIEDTTMEKIK
jgi:hypothetical protein